VKVSWVRLQLEQYFALRGQRTKPLRILALYVSGGERKTVNFYSNEIIRVEANARHILDLLRKSGTG
jgi:hypothetical protein